MTAPSSDNGPEVGIAPNGEPEPVPDPEHLDPTNPESAADAPQAGDDDKEQADD